jgi:outer membrane autotransporter protein
MGNGGIVAINSNGTGLTISAANVVGGEDGIAALNKGSGALSITATGAVKGGTGFGIAAVNYSTAAGSTSTVTVVDGSAVEGGATGVGLRTTTGRAATLNNAGSITGPTGVLATGGPTTISNTGSVTGTGGTAIDLTGAVGASTINQQGGTITGDTLLSAAADTINVTGGAIAGDIVGQGNADLNFAIAGGSFTFDAPFAITGMADVAMNSGTVAIAGTVDTDALTVNGGTMIIAGVVNTPAFDLNGGVLSVSSDANLGSGTGALNFDRGTFENTAAFTTARDIMLNAGSGTFQTDADLTVASAITGPGGLTKTGTAALTLNSVNTFAGLTTVDAGTLVVGDDTHAAASLAGDVLVNTGGTLGGIGTIGSTTIASGGTIAPGNSIGTLTVKGDITFAGGSTYLAEINPALDGDLIDASGKAAIDGGTVYAAKVAGVYTPDSRWTIVGADGGVTGTFDTLDQNMPFVDLALAYDANHVYIDATRNAVSFCDVAKTANQCSTGGGVESLGNGHPLYDVVAAVPDEDSARQAFDQLSGEIYASIKSALIENGHFVRDAVNDRIRSAFGDASGADMLVMGYGEGGPRPASADSIGPVAWGYAFGSWGSFDGDGNATMVTSNGGFLTGIDGEITSNIRLGLLAGYSRSSFDVGDRASSGDSDNYHLGLYAGGKWNALRLSGGLAYTWHDIETNRSVAFPGFSDSLSGDYNAGTFQVFGEAGYRIDAGPVAFEPFANLAYVNLHTDGFTEDGGDAALHIPGETTDATFTTLGLHVSSAFDLGGMKATAHGTLGWRHAFDDTTPISTNAFAGGDLFDVAGAPIAKDAALVEAGLDFTITKAATLGLAYQGQIASHATQNGFKADLSVRF